MRTATVWTARSISPFSEFPADPFYFVLWGFVLFYLLAGGFYVWICAGRRRLCPGDRARMIKRHFRLRFRQWPSHHDIFRCQVGHGSFSRPESLRPPLPLLTQGLQVAMFQYVFDPLHETSTVKGRSAGWRDIRERMRIMRYSALYRRMENGLGCGERFR